MATIYVKKDGTGDALTIQQGIQLAVAGDIVDIEAGTFDENIDLWKGITLKGAGVNQTIITTFLRTVITARPFIFVTGQTTLSLTQAAIDSGITTADYEVGRILTASGIPTNTRLVSKTPTSITLSAAVTSASASRTIAQAVQNDGGMRVRGVNGVIKDLKLIGFDHPTNPAVEYSALYLRNAGLGSAAANGWEIFNCEFQANGEYAILSDSTTAIANINIHDCLISGKTFVGDFPATGNQFSVWNVPRQLITIQGPNINVTFQNNTITGVTGGLTIEGTPSFNTAVTIDPVGAVVTGNTIDTESGYGYGLRVRGLNAQVENNFNIGDSAGYYVLPNHSVGALITVGTMIFNSSKYWICIQDHTSATTNAPTGVDGALFWSEITIEQVNESGVYGVGVEVLSSNLDVLPALITLAQENANDPVQLEYDPEMLSAISKVSSHPIFSEQENWHLVGFIFKHTQSSKRLYVGLKNQFTAKAIKLRTSISGETYELDKVIIANPERVFLAIQKSEIENASNYDITLK
jgi:hypothetical protein